MARTSRVNSLIAEKRLARIGPDLDRIKYLKETIADLSAELELLEIATSPLLLSLKDKGRQYNYNGNVFTAVQSTQTKYDDKRIRQDGEDQFGADFWDRVKKESLDRDKLGALVTQGIVTAEWVAARATVTDKKPYVLVNPGNAGKTTGGEVAQAA